MFQGVAFLPLAMLFIFRFFDSEKARQRTVNALIIGFLLAAMFIIGSTTFVFNLLLVIGAVFVYKAVKWALQKNYRTIFNYALYIVLIIFAMAFLSLGKAVALVDYTIVSDGHDILGFSGMDLFGGSFYPTAVIPFMVTPDIYSINYSAYEYMATVGAPSYNNFIGIVAFLLFAYSVFTIITKKVRSLYILLFLFVAFLLLSMGPYAGINFFGILTDIIPVFNRFRIPARLLLVAIPPLAVMSGYGLSNLQKMFEKYKVSIKNFNPGHMISVIIIILIAFEMFSFNMSGYKLEKMNIPPMQELNISKEDKVIVGDHIDWRRRYAPEYYGINYVNQNGVHFMHGILTAQLDWNDLENQYLKPKAAEALGVTKIITENTTRVLGPKKDPVYSTEYNFLVIVPEYDKKQTFLFWQLETNYYEQSIMQSLVVPYDLDNVTLVSATDQYVSKNPDMLKSFDLVYVYEGSQTAKTLPTIYKGPIITYGQDFQIAGNLTFDNISRLQFSNYVRGYSRSSFNVVTTRSDQ